jgi:hypothetical protein
VLATHSDVLDLLAQGGVFAISLWLWSYIRIGRLTFRNVLRGRVEDDLHAAVHTLACMSIAGILVYAFNPILLQPAKALLYWAQIGMLLGVALHFSGRTVEKPKPKVVLGQKLTLVPYYKNRKSNGYPLVKKSL